jgi:RHS repeat-associated protein
LDTGQRNLDAQGNSFSLGLMDYKARFYDQNIGRFVQADSITPGGPQGLNRYSYVLNNPVGYNDPTGNKACDEEFGCSGPLPKPAPIETITITDPPDDLPHNPTAAKKSAPPANSCGNTPEASSDGTNPYQYIQQQVEYCIENPFSIQCMNFRTSYPPVITNLASPTWNIYPPAGYKSGYKTIINVSKLDWLDLVLNGLGFLGNGAQAALAGGVITGPAIPPIAGITEGIEGLGYVYDVTRMTTQNDVSGATTDLVLKTMELSPYARFVPIAGMGANSINIAIDINNAKDRIPYILSITCCTTVPAYPSWPDFTTLPITVPQ